MFASPVRRRAAINLILVVEFLISLNKPRLFSLVCRLVQQLKPIGRRRLGRTAVTWLQLVFPRRRSRRAAAQNLSGRRSRGQPNRAVRPRYVRTKRAEGERRKLIEWTSSGGGVPSAVGRSAGRSLAGRLLHVRRGERESSRHLTKLIRTGRVATRIATETCRRNTTSALLIDERPRSMPVPPPRPPHLTSDHLPSSLSLSLSPSLPLSLCLSQLLKLTFVSATRLPFRRR